MAEYKVQWRYKSGLGGPWQEGEVVELDEVLAERVNVDSPGVLKAVHSKPLSVVSKSKQAVTKGKDRMVKGAKTPELPMDEVMSREASGYGAELLKDEET